MAVLGVIAVMLACLDADGAQALGSANIGAYTRPQPEFIGSSLHRPVSGPLASALADDTPAVPGEYSIFGQRSFSALCQCLFKGKLGGGRIPDTLPGHSLRECVNDAVAGCGAGGAGAGEAWTPDGLGTLPSEPARFEARTCRTFEAASTYLNTYGWRNDYEVTAVGHACSFDSMLHSAVEDACRPACVPAADHWLREPPMGEWVFTAHFNSTWWDSGRIDDCAPGHEPFGLCTHRRCLEAMRFYRTYHESGVSDCSYRDWLYEGHDGLTALLEGVCGGTPQGAMPANATRLERLQLFVFDERAWAEQVALFRATGSAAALQALKPDWGQLSATIMEAGPKVCKHLFEFNADEVATLLKSTNAPADVLARLERVDGPTLVSMDKEDMINLGIDVRWYSQWLRNLNLYLSPGVPQSLDRRGEASSVQVDVNVVNVYDINEEDYTFEALFEVNLMWTDVTAWVTCKAEILEEGVVDDAGSGSCRHLWRPSLRFENAREIEVLKRHIWSEAELKLGGIFMKIRGKFFASMSFRKYERSACARRPPRRGTPPSADARR